VTREHSDDGGRLIFVSYAHENKDWIKALGLDQIPASTESASFWLDENRVHAGGEWTSEAREALDRATAAVLLISREFLDSPSISEHELPPIMKRYRNGEICVVFVPIGPVKIDEIETKLQLAVRNIISIPSWSDPLPTSAAPRPDIREKIVSAATEPKEVQNLRRNITRQYELEEKLGDGVFSTVFKAHDHQLDRKVLVKLLRQENRAEHFKTVRKVGSATAHTNILSVYSAYLDADPPHYFVEYVSGQPLHVVLNEYWKTRLVQINHIHEFLRTVGSAITHAHSMGIDDINIKPCNIIVDNYRSPHEVNYFLNLNSYSETAFLQDHEWRTSRDDVLYLPLEYRMPDVHPDGEQKADQYRLGLVAYEMLVGSTRFKELGKSLRRRIVPASWHWPSLTTQRKDCPQHICDVVDRMVKTNPRDRYASIDEVVASIRDTDLDVETVRDSYRRLMSSEDTQTAFFQSFYARFLEKYPRASGFFRARRFGCLTEDCIPSGVWQRHFQVLKEAVLLLIVFKSFREEKRELNILTRIAEEHAKKGIPAGLYTCFGELLVEVILEKDRQAPLKRDALRDAWTSVIQPGIEYMERKTVEIEVGSYRQKSRSSRRDGRHLPENRLEADSGMS
jgi:serine/threonine protein kinase